MSPVSSGNEDRSNQNSNLNANALEFIPSISNQIEKNVNNLTGTTPKKFFPQKRSDFRREKLYNNNYKKISQNNNQQEEIAETSRKIKTQNENSFNGADVANSKKNDDRNRKFFANNNYQHIKKDYYKQRSIREQELYLRNENNNPGVEQEFEHLGPNKSKNVKNPENDKNKNHVNIRKNGRFLNSRNNNNYNRDYNGIRSNEAVASNDIQDYKNQFRKEETNDNVRFPKRNNRKKNYSKETSSVSQRDRLIKEIEGNTLECMICCEKIKSYQPIWSCTNCYHILHLNCIKTWMKNSVNDEGGWRCPACNNITKQKPTDYVCFCGKMKNPPVNRHDLAHSCGEMCLNTQNCPHPCSIKCHPGPHETCYASIQKYCGCGKTSKTYQCSMKATFECDLICDKVLNCSIHKCNQKCHQGDCENCTEEIECSCFCGSEKKFVPCTVDNLSKIKYSCEKECGKMLNCLNHICKLKCHEGDCGKCKLLPEFVLSCCCTQTPVKEGTRTSCLDPIPVCQNICKKSLRCGKLSSPHTCASKCHLGECPPCNQTSNVKCRCGRKEERIPCKDLTNTDLRCKKKCNKFKSCGRHKCNLECCIDIYHTCAQNCNRLLNCKLHKCQRSCHVGNCSPCHRVSFDELRCECGATVIFPPVPCNTKITDCPQKCIRQHKCNHPVAHNCHSDPECPPCVFLTSKFCYGKHEERKTIPCNQDSFCCGMPCGKLLKCGRHSCIKTCHEGECEKNGEICKQKCTVKRLECEHNCNAQCHDGDCPNNISCREKVQVSCDCGNLKDFKTCEQVQYENKKLQRVHITMQMQDQQSDGITDLNSMLGAFKKTIKILECNEECKLIERNRRLDIAFKVQNPSLASTPKFIPTYSDHVRNFYKKDPTFVNMVHEKLTELVKLAKESKAPYRCYSFPSMNRDKRHVIHDMAELFGVESKAYDAEPNRNIVATAMREYCWLPSMSVAEVASREQGARRPPSNLTIKK